MPHLPVRTFCAWVWRRQFPLSEDGRGLGGHRRVEHRGCGGHGLPRRTLSRTQLSRPTNKEELITFHDFDACFFFCGMLWAMSPWQMACKNNTSTVYGYDTAHTWILAPMFWILHLSTAVKVPKIMTICFKKECELCNVCVVNLGTYYLAYTVGT